MSCFIVAAAGTASEGACASAQAPRRIIAAIRSRFIIDTVYREPSARWKPVPGCLCLDACAWMPVPGCHQALERAKDRALISDTGIERHRLRGMLSRRLKS